VRALPGDRFAYFTVDGDIGVAGPATGELRSLTHDPRNYSFDGVYLFTAGDVILFGGDARRVDAVTGQVSPLADVPPGLACAARLPSGEAAVIWPDGTLRLYDATLTTSRLEHRVIAGVVECSARRDGSLALGATSGVVVVVDPQTGAELGRDVRAVVASVEALAVLPDGTVVSGDFRGEVRAWTVGAPSRPLLRHDGPVWGLAVSPDGRSIASCGRDRSVRISTAEGAVVQVFRGHRDEVSSVLFASGGDAVVSASMDGTILRWPIDLRRAPPATAAALALHLRELTRIAVEPGSR
jgi:WD40 repeat protein